MQIVEIINNVSMEEKRQISFHFCCKLAYADSHGNLRELSENDMDFVHNILDGNHGLREYFYDLFYWALKEFQR